MTNLHALLLIVRRIFCATTCAAMVSLAACSEIESAVPEAEAPPASDQAAEGAAPPPVSPGEEGLGEAAPDGASDEESPASELEAPPPPPPPPLPPAPPSSPPPPPSAAQDAPAEQAPMAPGAPGAAERPRMAERQQDQREGFSIQRDRSGAAARSAPPSDGPSGVATNRITTPVLVELLAEEARQPRQGGSAVVLLAPPGSPAADAKNLALCRALFLSFDQATTREVDLGSRRTAEGEVQLLRPLYWLTRSVMNRAPGADRCPERIDTYDFPRADRIRRKLGLTGEGPFLVIERHDLLEGERTAAVIELSRARPQEIADIVRYFREGFMQAGDVWEPSRFTPQRARQDIASGLGRDVARGLAPRLIRTTRQVGCAFTNLLDVCAPAP